MGDDSAISHTSIGRVTRTTAALVAHYVSHEWPGLAIA